MSKESKEEMVTIAKAEYDRLTESDLHLNLLECRGVDNWQGYSGLPDREDYDTEEEYNKAVEDAFNGDGW